MPFSEPNHPDHFNETNIEIIDIIEAFDLGFHLGNALKYLLRAHLKGNYVNDLKKADWYIIRFRESSTISHKIIEPNISIDKALFGRQISHKVHKACRALLESQLYGTGLSDSVSNLINQDIHRIGWSNA